MKIKVKTKTKKYISLQINKTELLALIAVTSQSSASDEQCIKETLTTVSDNVSVNLEDVMHAVADFNDLLTDYAYDNNIFD